jgi:hypothetical protein
MNNVNTLRRTLRKEGHHVYDRPWELNIVGLRADSTQPNSFDDAIMVFYRDDEMQWQLHAWPATTDPGTYWLRSPMHEQGTAILKGNRQYLDAYGIAQHQGKYYALCQIHQPVTVIRDYDRDNELDFLNGEEMTGMFGINIHRATSNGTTREVDRYSAGCQVFSNSEAFVEFMSLCEVHRDRYGNVFSYTLLDQRAVRRTKRRRLVVGGTAAATGIIGGIKLYQWWRRLQKTDE